jgi:23S rRNA (guanosine2251-2'-O)-methyltransferase
VADSEDYKNRKAQFDRLLTLYGRKPVLEALQSSQIAPQRLHLSNRNKPAAILEEIITLAEKRGAEIRHHDPLALSRISRNSQQDQGVAADLLCPTHQPLDDFLDQAPQKFRLLMLDGLTNPQNLGMIIRSVAASPVDGLLFSEKDNIRISPLVIKASAGALFRAPLIHCKSNAEALQKLRNYSATFYGMSGNSPNSLLDTELIDPSVIILGGETQGLSKEVAQQVDHLLGIPMNRGVESLNVAVSATLAAYLPR